MRSRTEDDMKAILQLMHWCVLFMRKSKVNEMRLRLLPVIALSSGSFSLRHIKKPNHLRAEDGWDDRKNFYAFFRYGAYWKSDPVKLKVNLPVASTDPTTVQPEFAIEAPVIVQV